MKKKLIHNISFWLCPLLLMSTSSIIAQENYSVSGAIDYSGPQAGDLIIRAWPVNAENNGRTTTQSVDINTQQTCILPKGIKINMYLKINNLTTLPDHMIIKIYVNIPLFLSCSNLTQRYCIVVNLSRTTEQRVPKQTTQFLT